MNCLRSIARLFIILGLFIIALPSNSAADEGDFFSRIKFTGKDGKELSLKQFKGKVIALHFWATWCPPCVEEMPALDRAQKDFSERGFEVVALSQDFKGVQIVSEFYEKNGINNLNAYADKKSQVFSMMHITGLPTTIFIAPDGSEIDRINGSLLWDKPDVRKTLDEIIKKTSGK